MQQILAKTDKADTLVMWHKMRFCCICVERWKILATNTTIYRGSIRGKTMRNAALAFLLTIGCLIGGASGSSACTSVVLNKTAGIVVSGRTLDYPADLGSRICFRERGTTTTDPNVEYTGATFKPVTWTAKYDTVLVDGLNLQAYTDGMNNEGLSVATLWQDETQPAKTVQPGTNGLANVSLVQYVLDNAKDVAEAKELISKLSVFLSAYKGGDLLLHWIVTDKSGKSVVVELKDGRPVFFDQITKVGVMTNSPTYDQQLTNLSAQEDARKKDPSLGLPGDYRPTSRFVKAAYLVESTPNLVSPADAMATTLQILHNVEVPRGAQASGSYTQWMAVRDQTNLKYWVVTPTGMAPLVIDMKKLDFKAAAGKKIAVATAAPSDLAALLKADTAMDNAGATHVTASSGAAH